MSRAHDENAFETEIVRSMVEHGWLQGSPADYNRELGLDTGQLFTFIGATQSDLWEEYTSQHSGDANLAQRKFAEVLAKQLTQYGALYVLRNGVSDSGFVFNMAYFRPSHTITASALAEYNNNRLTVVRQLHYSPRDPALSLDLTLFVNGIPVATAELKNPFTRQTVEHAKHQYRRRDQRDLIFQHRALVHFAVDPDLVFLTTRLEGEKTRFLPFNTGSSGPGRTGGAGNPEASDGSHRTSYLWRQIWHPDTWLELLQRFLHEQDSSSGKKGKSKGAARKQRDLIFPRFHQWHAVGQLIDHAEHHGSGNNYLIQHSAGSGKSNTIAWLSHRLSTLHTPADPSKLDPSARERGYGQNQPVFDKVFVITDRTVLDRQLQDTVRQFERTNGVVERIGTGTGSKSAQVAAALASSTAKIIIGTLQTFPYVLDQVSSTAGKRFAVIVDEAHSSQSGDAAAALKKVLTKLGSDDLDDDGDPLTASALARGKHETLSYFAFTATPKTKTLNLFGSPSPEDPDERRPFHVYSMHQAIEEGFVLDVLSNYVTYDTYYKLSHPVGDDREVDEKKAKSQLAAFAQLHPTNKLQRAEIIIEHFRRHTASRLGGRAKAMVVTASREDAVRQYQALLKYIDTRGYEQEGIGVLVAFSGSLEIDGKEVTEAGINGFGETELPEQFNYTRADDEHAAARNKPEFRILVVADKYQTGFDQPLLSTMYVDKKLANVAAVQTLSRLNRTHRLKSQDDVFVLDFKNDAAVIQKEFKPFYETTLTDAADPNLLYDARHEVMGYPILVESEMQAFADAYSAAERSTTTQAQWSKAHAELYRFTDPAKDRFVQLRTDDEAEAEEFRSALINFVRLYGFLGQLMPRPDADLERLYLYGKHLLNRLPRGESRGVDIGQVDLTHLRISKSGEHDLTLTAEGEQKVPGLSDGTGGVPQEPDQVPLSALIAEFNEKYGVNLTETDLVAPMLKTMKKPKVAAAAGLTDLDNFGDVFDEDFQDEVEERAMDNTVFLKKFMDDEGFRAEYTKLARRNAYEMLRSGLGA
ncbi:type I restriction endonuclease subunit R [Streptomyces sp. NBC_00658]|uniref:type I restriction endonuclease subunit R n=1 Tax=Streptomyces sp. NBC_00658 TaxID=2975800 RepID=UPI00324B85AB